MTKNQQTSPSALVYDDKGTMLVNEQIMQSYNSGTIDKRGLHGELSERLDEGAAQANEQVMNSYSSGSINKSGLHGDLFGIQGAKE